MIWWFISSKENNKLRVDDTYPWLGITLYNYVRMLLIAFSH
jgi:hypothetical protein